MYITIYIFHITKYIYITIYKYVCVSVLHLKMYVNYVYINICVQYACM